ncbi:Imp4 [Phodopus roborovskii]|uniref:Imp4 protein n=1 Tax=Phodopus roborovskii TaxID=109678 RepID=A0AAV0A3D4_PHORO|nr:Imp4 [Phodopus roborovskii]
MLRREARLRREYLYRKAREDAQRSVQEKKERVKRALEENQLIPTELRREALALQGSLEFDDAGGEGKTVVRPSATLSQLLGSCPPQPHRPFPYLPSCLPVWRHRAFSLNECFRLRLHNGKHRSLHSAHSPSLPQQNTVPRRLVRCIV